jgi:hypothetical protein
VGLESILLTSHIYSCTQSMVPCLGDDEFGTAWSDPRLGALSPKARAVPCGQLPRRLEASTSLAFPHSR